MTLKICLSAVLLTSFGVIQAQNHSESSLKKLRFSDVSVLSGFWLNQEWIAGQDNFQKLVPNSRLAGVDLTDFENHTTGANSGGSGFHLMSNLQLLNSNGNAYRKNFSLRLGLSYRQSIFISDQYHISERTAYDTLTSSSGNPVHVDTVSNRGIAMQYDLRTVGLHAAAIWSTSAGSRWSLYGGAGASVNYALQASTHINTYRYGWLAYGDDKQHPGEIDNKNFETERFDNRLSYGFQLYIPAGVDFRIGNKREWLRPWHVFYEVRPGIDFRHIPELGMITRAHLYRGLGVRYEFR